MKIGLSKANAHWSMRMREKKTHTHCLFSNMEAKDYNMNVILAIHLVINKSERAHHH